MRCDSQDWLPFATGAAGDTDLTDYPDDFEEVEEDDLMDVVSNAKVAMEMSVEDDDFEEEVHLKDAGGLSVTMKVLRERYLGKCKASSVKEGLSCRHLKGNLTLFGLS